MTFFLVGLVLRRDYLYLSLSYYLVFGMTETYRRKVSGKGQVVVAKPLREKHGIKEGGWVRQFSTGNGVLLVPVSVDGLLEELEEVASEVGEAWQEGVSAVEGVRGDREKRWPRK